MIEPNPVEISFFSQNPHTEVDGQEGTDERVIPTSLTFSCSRSRLRPYLLVAVGLSPPMVEAV